MCWPRISSLACGIALLGVVALPPVASAHLAARRLSASETVAPVPSPMPALAAPDLSWKAAPVPVPIPWHLVALLLGIAVLGARRPRRAVGLALILLLAVFAFESGVHSVHHLSDPSRAEHCGVASASQHMSGTEVAGVTVAESLPQAPHQVLLAAPIARVRSLGPEQGRAPPLVASL